MQSSITGKGGVQISAPYPPRSAVIGWVLFEWAATPYPILIVTFVFAPYFATHIAADPATGQALWGFATAIAGVIIALLSPILGAISDARGRRKPWIAIFGALLVIGSAFMWIGKPGEQSTILPLLIAFGIATVGVEFAIVFNNAMMPTLVPPERIGRLSGTGWAIGYLGGITSLFLVLCFLAANPETGRTLLGYKPLFDLDPTMHEGDRITGPLTGLWFIIFVLPMFLFTPDYPAKLPMRAAVRKGLEKLRETLGSLPHNRQMTMFLIANMIYMDALVALFAFGGIYAAGTFGWHTAQIGMFGILLAFSGALGAWLGGLLDERLGPKKVMIGSMLTLLFAGTMILLVDRDRLGFIIPIAPPEPDGGLFVAPAEKIYLTLGFLIGMAAAPLQAASRAMLIQLAPQDRMTQYFGLFALSGKMTSFIAPLIVSLVTSVTSSQKAGMAVLIVFFLAGLLLLLRVRDQSNQNRLGEG